MVFHSPSAKLARYHHWKAHTDAIQQLTFGALDYGWNILLGHGAAHDGIVEFKAWQRLELEKLVNLVVVGLEISDWYRSWSYLSFSLTAYGIFWFSGTARSDKLL